MSFAIRNDLLGWRSVNGPEDCTADEHYSESQPVLPDPIPTREQVEAMRLTAYANAVTGSDRYFAEAARMQAMSESGWEEVRAAGVARYQAIQAEYPWP